MRNFLKKTVKIASVMLTPIMCLYLV